MVMRTTHLAVLLLAVTHAGVAAADDNTTLRNEVRAFRDTAGGFSHRMGLAASKTAALAERALRGMAMSNGGALDLEKDARGVTRLWRLDKEGDRLDASRVASVGEDFGYETK